MSESKHAFIGIDFQNEFVHPNGRYFTSGKSVSFINDELIPFFRRHNIVVHEIISDYRLPRHTSSGNYCDPNEFGYESMLPDDIKSTRAWIKSMHNPTWIRENGGCKSKKPGLPYPDPELFSKWLEENVGLPRDNLKVYLFGETLEVCVHAVAQELYYRGYQVSIIYEASDPMNERLYMKDYIAFDSALSLYANVISFSQLKKELEINSEDDQND